MSENERYPEHARVDELRADEDPARARAVGEDSVTIEDALRTIERMRAVVEAARALVDEAGVVGPVTCPRAARRARPCAAVECSFCTLVAALATLDASTPSCPRAVYGDDARVAFDRDIYDCARCGHMIGDHCGPHGECVICAEVDHG